MAGTGFINKAPQVLRYNVRTGNSSNDWSDPDDFRGLDTVQFFCDADAADDSGTGLTSNSPKKTTPAIMALFQAAQQAFPGRPDQVLFKVATTGAYAKIGILTDTGLGNGNGLAGRSSIQRIVFGTYGVGDRAKFETGTDPVIITKSGALTFGGANHNIAILGLDFKCDGFVPGTNNVTCVSVLGSLSNILIENCKFNAASFGIDMAVVGGPFTREDLVIRRNVFQDGHINFIRLIATDGVLIEENYFDNMIVLTAGTNNIRFKQSRCIEAWVGARNTEVKGNTFTNYGTRGMWFGSGAIVHGNVFVGGLVAIHIGNNWEQPETSYPFGSLSVQGGGITLCDIAGNYVGEGTNLISGDGAAHTGPMGIYIQNIAPGASPRPRAADNIIAKSSGSGLNFGIYINGTGSNGAGLGCGVRGLTVQHNKIFKWYTGAPGQNFSGRAVEISGWNIQPTGMMIYDLDFLNNDLQEPIAHQGSILRLDPTTTTVGTAYPPQYEGAFNRFWRTGNNLLYSVNGIGDSDLNTYRQYTGDASSFEIQVPYPFPNRTIGEYHGTLGGTATLAGYVTVVRGQSRANWNNALMAKAVITYIEEGFDA